MNCALLKKKHYHIYLKFIGGIIYDEEDFKNHDQFLADGFIKVPIWSGQFLRKIDLSKISFENVTWILEDYPLIYREMKEKYNFDGYVDYSYTNANIDFSSSFEAKQYKEGKKNVMYINNCNFAGVDLSNNDIRDAQIYSSNISQTKLNLENAVLYCGDTNFTGINLSHYNINIDTFLSDEGGNIQLGEAGNFSNTKLNFVGDIDSLSLDKKRVFCSYIRNGQLNGCLLNGKLMTGLEESNSIDKKSEYEKMKEDLLAAVTQSIEEQKKSFRR